MNLFDPDRPKIYHKPAFLPGHCIIPSIQIWPLEGGQIQLSMMLPLQDNRFSGKYFAINTLLANIPDLISQFVEDPEKFVQTYFDKDPTGMLPGISPKGPPATSKAPTTKTLELLDE